MKRIQLASMLAAALALGIVLSWNTHTAAQSSGFDAGQVGEIETIVRDYLLTNPEILREVMSALKEKETAERAAKTASAIKKYNDEILSSPANMVLGNPDGDITLVEFFDYNCGYCKRAMPDLTALLETDKNLRVVLKEFPILTEGSVESAKASIAAANQDRYLEFHAELLGFHGTNDSASAMQVAEVLGLDLEQFESDMAAPETLKILSETKTLATNIGIEVTPAYIIGTTLVPGAIGLEGLRQVIAETRATN